MRVEGVAGISQWLKESVNNLGESLLEDLRLTNFGYSVRIEFSVIIDLTGQLMEEPETVVFELDGVQRLVLNGDLTEYMMDHPEVINWSLSDVAQVRVATGEVGIHFEAAWEDERRIEVECRRAVMTAPGNELVNRKVPE